MKTEKQKLCNRLYMRAWAKANPEQNRVKARAWARANSEKNRERVRAWKKANRERVNKNARRYLAVRYQEDVNFRILCSLRRRMLKAISGAKAANTKELLGANLDFIREYLEAQFQPGMSWKNHGFHGWHIDHKRPCESFDLTDPKQQKQCFHYTNLQPLWSKDNWRKGAKWQLVY